jgi:hypothetical protein
LDWDNSSQIGPTVIAQIQDPNGDTASREITSIPSPFARIDLVKTAFEKVADSNNLDGDSIHHKMVSDALDVGQIFFEFDKFRDKFEIIVWDKTNNLDELLNSQFPEHRQLGDTIQTYLQQDGAEYGFDKMDRMYFLNFKSGPSEMNIIGATSPATLFFTSANNLSYVSGAITFGLDRPFDEDLLQLYRRDFEYQKYWYALRKSIPDFAQRFPEVEKYLVKNLQLMSQESRNRINAIVGSDYLNYSTISVGANANQTISIHNGIDLRQKVQNVANIAEVSGFVINSHNRLDGFLPLVLPVDTYTRPTIYVSDVWDRNIKAPFYDPRPITERILPADGAPYPYLTISDFLTDTIVRMPYEINSNKFFNGNINKAEGYSYLLPLTGTFFHFFSVEDLKRNNMFELQWNAAGVTAVLRIPVRGGQIIEYRRTYFDGSTDTSQTKKTNDGVLLDKKLGLGIMPLIQFPDNVDKYYRIALFDKGRNDVKLTCYKNNTVIPEEEHIVRDKKDIEMNECSKESYVITDNFDRIEVEVGDVRGVVVPKFDTRGGNKIYTFAIDFGTTNTHIEYGVVTSAGQVPSNSDAFDIPLGEKQMHRLHKQYSDRDINGAFVHNFVPDSIGDANDDFSFPMRTVFSEWNQNRHDSKMYALANGNIPFLYEKGLFPDSYNEARTELKWRGEDEDCLVKLYLENIFLLLRNKVVLNGGNLAATKIIWFYPASMDTGKFDNFNGYWAEFYKKYFGSDAENNLITISESAAPHSYYKRKKGASSEVVTIDVGGGTTDVYSQSLTTPVFQY